MAQNIYDQIPPELIGDQRTLERQQKIAEAMMAQGMSPQEAGKMVGRFYVPPSPVQGIAKMFQAYQGGKMGGDVDKGFGELAKRRGDIEADEVKRYQQMRTGTPGSSEMIIDEMANQGAGAPATINAPGIPADPRAAVEMAMMSRQPGLQRMGTVDAAQMARQPEIDLKRSEGKENREARLYERILALDAAAQNAALSREDRAARAQESAALRRELQQNQLQVSQQINAGRREDRAAAESARREDRSIARADKAAQIEQKRQDKLEAAVGKQDQGKSRVSTNLNALTEYYDDLERLGAVVDSSKSTASNISARARASGVGQFVGGTIGSEEQVYRENINQMRPLLLQEIRQASAMGARGLDSNKELEFYLQAATDPKKDIKTNRAAVSVLEKAYGLGSMIKGVDDSAVAALKKEFGGAAPKQSPADKEALSWANSNPNDPRSAAIKQRLGVR